MNVRFIFVKLNLPKVRTQVTGGYLDTCEVMW